MSAEFCQIICTEELINNNGKILVKWLEKHAKEYQFKYLLAHAEDGLMWGKFENDELKTADTVFPEHCPKLRLLTLQQCRIFGESGEILLWKTEQKWNARLVQDNSTQDCLEEAQILWGTKIESEKDGFTLLADGSEGLKHAVPLTDLKCYFPEDQKKGKLHRPIRLIIKHYINYNETGIARVSLSRLVSLKAEPKQGDKP